MIVLAPWLTFPKYILESPNLLAEAFHVQNSYSIRSVGGCHRPLDPKPDNPMLTIKPQLDRHTGVRNRRGDQRTQVRDQN